MAAFNQTRRGHKATFVSRNLNRLERSKAVKKKPELRFADELARPPRQLFDTRDLMLPRNAYLAASRESEVHNTDKEFRIRLELQNFKTEEVKITSDNQRVTISAKHEEKQDKHGYVSREITRVYLLPKDVDPKSVTSTMNSQGILSIKATKQALEAKEISIPVEFKD